MISGTTILLAQLGFPTEVFKAPMIFNSYFQDAGIDAVVVPMGVQADDYPAFLKQLVRVTNLRGALITTPHKVTTMSLVNATPMGMNEGDPLPVDVSRLDPGTFVGEVVTKQAITPFLAAAQERGCEIQMGTDMLFEQIPAYLEFCRFPSTTPDRLRALAQIKY